MVAEPDGAWTTEERCERVYPETNRVEKKHRVSVLRAARRVVENDPDWVLTCSKSLGGQRVLMSWADVRSYALGRLKSENQYKSNDTRLRWSYSAKELADTLETEHYQKLMAPGGDWWRHVHRHIAEPDGGAEVSERLTEAEQKVRASLAHTLSSLRRR